MSKNLNLAAVKEFDTLVKQSYQAKGGRIRSTIQQRTAVVGDTYHFRSIGQGVASLRMNGGALLEPMGITHHTFPAVLNNYYAAEFTDIFDAANVNFDEKAALADSMAMAIKRREDKIIIDAFHQAKLDESNLLRSDVSGTATKELGVNAIIKAGEVLSETDSSAQKYMLISPAMRTSLLKDIKNQSHFADFKHLASGELMEFAGFKFIYIENSRQEGGLPTVEKGLDGFQEGEKWAIAYLENAAGIAIGIDMRIEINYVAEKASWLTAGVFKAGATVIDKAGVVKIACA